MSAQLRHNVHLAGQGAATMVFAHGFGCDQTMWRHLAPAYQHRYRVLTYDLVGSGGSDLSAYDRARHATLQGHADDLLALIDAHASGPVVFVGHSVGATIGMLATIAAPERFAAQIMVSPSPCYINDGDYTGGFTRDDIDELLETMETNFIAWSHSLAPTIMGAPNQPHLASGLTASFCRNNPEIAHHFASVTFRSDHRLDVPRSTTPALILQCSDDLIAPRTAGQWLHQNLPGSTFAMVPNVGHCPHMSAATDVSAAIDAFLTQQLR
jgi:sigma-B regulation protein RsbQ